VRVPANVSPGKAKVTLSFAECEEAEVAPAVVEVDIVQGQKELR
jgi:hypothetical protein